MAVHDELAKIRVNTGLQATFRSDDCVFEAWDAWFGVRGPDADTVIRRVESLRGMERRPADAADEPATLTTEPVPQAPDAPTTPSPDGMTGDTCSNCGSLHMTRSGSCSTCLDCGTTSGCS